MILSRLMLRGCRSEAVRNRNHQPLRGARPAIKRGRRRRGWNGRAGGRVDDVSPARRAVAVVSPPPGRPDKDRSNLMRRTVLRGRRKERRKKRSRYGWELGMVSEGGRSYGTPPGR